jgi:predicted NAD-dependent protein-ADP-ribosyltransferase YbiA (DUF1768 family)
MGGCCWLVQADGKRVKGPQATNNFAVVPAGFLYKGTLFYSTEQAFQASKFAPGSPAFRRVAAILPEEGDSGSAHGMACWQAGQGGEMVQDWDRVKVGVMLDVCRAKVVSVPGLKEELLATGTCAIEGGASTEWAFRGAAHGWQLWNGRVQMLLREELREEPDSALLASLQALFAEYAGEAPAAAGGTAGQ